MRRVRGTRKRQTANLVSNADLLAIVVEWRRVVAVYRRGEEITGVADPVRSAARLEHLAVQLETIVNDRLEVNNQTIFLERDEE